MFFDAIDALIAFLIHHQALAYGILFAGSMFETIIGFSFFVYGEIFFLSGSILAGMGILNVWEVMGVLYLGGMVGDSISYFLGKAYGFALYTRLSRVPILQKHINKSRFSKGARFFRKHGAWSVFFGRLLGPISWVTPFMAGTYQLAYRKFLPFEMMGVVIGIGQFIVAGYFFGKHFDQVLRWVETYIVVLVFLSVLGYIAYHYLKKKQILSHWRRLLREDRKKAIKRMMKDSFFSLILLSVIYGLFLFFVFFVDDESRKPLSVSPYERNISLNLTDCKQLGLYYADAPAVIVQPINIILKTSLSVQEIVDGSWVHNDIFRQDRISFSDYIHLFRQKVLPVSSLYFQGLPQNDAYQYRSRSLSQREHIRFWECIHKGSNLKTYYASISFDHGYWMSFYNSFITPVHKIDKAIDASRDFFRDYLQRRHDLKVQCHYRPTPCRIQEITGDNEPSEEQRYYTDGRVLECTLQKKAADSQ